MKFMKLHESLLCFDLICKDKLCVQELTCVYCDILINIELVSSNLPKHNKRLNGVILIGWNNIIKSLYKDARNAFLVWHNQGKPRYGNIKEGLKLCRKNGL